MDKAAEAISLKQKAEAIKAVVLDIDGVLTDGTIYYGSNGIELKGFHIHDGLGIKLLQQAGIEVAVISGKDTESVKRRLADLNIKHAYLGKSDKIPSYEDLKQKLGLTDQQIAYMGDDLPDYALLKACGLAVSVPNAPAEIVQIVDFSTQKPGGSGAVRELCEYILKAQSKFESVVESYLTQT